MSSIKKQVLVLRAVLKSLEKAIARLEEAAKLPRTEINRDATIKRFEFTFELSWKAIQRFFRNQNINAASPKEYFRKAANVGIITDPTGWFHYLEARNLTTHVYSENVANQVYAKAKTFPREARKLLEKLKQKTEK